MCNKRISRAGPGPARVFASAVAAALALAVLPTAANAETPPAPVPAVSPAAALKGAQSIQDFYRARAGHPLFVDSPAATQQLLEVLSNAATDGLDPKRYMLDRVRQAVSDARAGDPRARNAAEWLLAQSYVMYAGDLRRAPNVGVIYVDRELYPAVPSPRALLDAAAAAPSLETFLASIGWLNPAYGQLRQALLSGLYADPKQQKLIALNLQRARLLPSGPGRYVEVNTAAQRLFMFEGGQVVDSMKVVVGKAKNPTPMMAAFIRFASLNPYWNVPPDLAAERIAPNVVKIGMSYLKQKGYQVLSDWGAAPTVIDPKTIDWKGVANGTVDIRVRQLPGPSNAMGQMKFMFPNAAGVYLHDTPEKQLLTEAARLFSGGCIRLEDAPRLGRWLFGYSLDPKGAGTEAPVPLPTPVPVYVTYLTAVPDGSQIVFMDDIYGRDAARLAETAASDVASR
jgi:murein L,D-transpeptidase YcbB/YkuD